MCRALQDEILRIKDLQHDGIAFKFDDKYMNPISFYYKKNSFSLLVNPLINTVITLVCILFMLIFIVSFSFTSILFKIASIIIITHAFVLYISSYDHNEIN